MDECWRLNEVEDTQDELGRKSLVKCHRAGGNLSFVWKGCIYQDCQTVKLHRVFLMLAQGCLGGCLQKLLTYNKSWRGYVAAVPHDCSLALSPSALTHLVLPGFHYS